VLAQIDLGNLCNLTLFAPVDRKRRIEPGCRMPRTHFCKNHIFSVTSNDIHLSETTDKIPLDDLVASADQVIRSQLFGEVPSFASAGPGLGSEKTTEEPAFFGFLQFRFS
jgi:hypothetical protein